MLVLVVTNYNFPYAIIIKGIKVSYKSCIIIYFSSSKCVWVSGWWYLYMWCRHDVGRSSRGACAPLDIGDAFVKHRMSSIGLAINQ